MTELEREMFQTYFDMELPDYISVLNCEYRFDDDNCFFAAKAVMARKDVSRFTHYIEQGHDARAQINKYEFGYQAMADDFREELPRWE